MADTLGYNFHHLANQKVNQGTILNKIKNMLLYEQERQDYENNCLDHHLH